MPHDEKGNFKCSQLERQTERLTDRQICIYRQTSRQTDREIVVRHVNIQSNRELAIQFT